MQRESTKHKNIPADLLRQYLAREITSEQLAKLTGYHPVYLRRTIKRGKRTTPTKSTKLAKNMALKTARDNMRKSVAHLPTKEIVELANVSVSTALRIRKKYAS